jgi:hypothetical protein
VSSFIIKIEKEKKTKNITASRFVNYKDAGMVIYDRDKRVPLLMVEKR